MYYIIIIISSFILSHPVLANKNILVTIKPIHSLVSNVMQGVGSPELLIESKITPHDFHMKPLHARKLSRADMVFYVDKNLENSLIKSFGNLPNNVELVPLTRNKKIKKIRNDYHIWLNTENAKEIIEMARIYLSTSYPKQAKKYNSNAEVAINKLEHLEEKIKSVISELEDKSVIVSHNAYRHFAKKYGIKIRGALFISDRSEVTARHIRKIRKIIKQYNIGCFLTDDFSSEKLVDSVTNGLSVRVQKVDFLGNNLMPGPDLYFDLMNNFLKDLKNCIN